MLFGFNLNSRKIGLGLGIVSLYLAGQSLLNEYLIENVLSDETGEIAVLLLDLFSVNLEESIPTWYATLLLFLAAVTLFFIAVMKRRQAAVFTRHWFFLGGVFLYLSMDEGAVIHEIVSEALEAWLETGGYLSFPWVIVFVPLALLLGIVYLPFLRHLPVVTRNLVIAAGMIYVGGAAGVEMISAGRYAAEGITFTYLAIATVEELFEMLGVVLFIYALVAYIEMEQLTGVAGFSQKLRVVNRAGSTKGGSWGGVIALGIVGVIFLVNVGVVGWATVQTAVPEVVEPTNLPFYQAVTEQYAEQGVLVLGLGEVIEPNNPAARPIAESLLTLFEDVMIVTLPTSQVSIAFASASLPFDEEALAVILVENGESEYVILDRAAVWTIANGGSSYP